MAYIINAKNISKTLDERLIINDISLQINRGEKVAICGEPGCSRSTFFETNSNFDTTAQIRQNSIGFLFQELHLIPFNNVCENISVPLLLNSYSIEKSRPLVESVMDDLGLLGLENAMPASLSEDEKQRVALARAIVHSPNLILANDPTGDLNSRDEELILELINATVSDRQCALVLVTQSTKAASICSSQYILENGSLTVSQ